MQAVINAAAVGGKISQLYIPTPEARVSVLRYEDLYPKRWVQPATYIRFSSTVEDCRGTQYCMSSDDEGFLAALNARKPATHQCSEDQFEEVVDFFERTAQEKQPYATVDNAPVLSYEELEAAFDETISDGARRFAREIYDHWKRQRLNRGNRSLMPSLKFETNLETDDADPYVCFRRREVRQARKTRGRDAQVTEKLKKLRVELEQARELMSLLKQREAGRREQLANDRLIFEKRMEVREVKRNLNIKDGDEDLINQKVSQITRIVSHLLMKSSPLQNPSPSSMRTSFNEACLAWLPNHKPVSTAARWTAISSCWKIRLPRERRTSPGPSKPTRKNTASGTSTMSTSLGGRSLLLSRKTPNQPSVPLSHSTYLHLQHLSRQTRRSRPIKQMLRSLRKKPAWSDTRHPRTSHFRAVRPSGGALGAGGDS